MDTAEQFTAVEYRLARHYLRILRTANAVYKRGHDNSVDGLLLFDQEWSQIKQWQDWSVAHAHNHDEIARLSQEYSQAGDELFMLRQHPQERLKSLETGLECARHLGDAQAEMSHLVLLGMAHFQLHSNRDAQNFVEQALALARQADNKLYICRSLNVLGNIFYIQDDYERSRITQ